jgi:hypothetical protein
MKTKIALGAMAMTVATFASAHIKNDAAEQAGKKIFAAFQHSTYREYNSFVPTLPQLLQLMDEHGSFYGPFLKEAKEQLSKQYGGDVKRIETSFVSALEEGDRNHISWSKAAFVSAERENETLVIEFSVEGKSHKIQIAVTEIDGELRTGKVIGCI